MAASRAEGFAGPKSSRTSFPSWPAGVPHAEAFRKAVTFRHPQFSIRRQRDTANRVQAFLLPRSKKRPPARLTCDPTGIVHIKQGARLHLMIGRAKSDIGGVHVELRSVADHGERGDLHVAIQRRQIAGDDPKRIVSKKDSSEHAAAQRDDPEIRIGEFSRGVRQFRLGWGHIDHPRRCPDHGLDVLTGLRIEDGEKLGTGETEIDVAVAHGHGIRGVGFLARIGGPKGGDGQVESAVGPRDGFSVLRIEPIDRAPLCRGPGEAAEDVNQPVVHRQRLASRRSLAATVRPLDVPIKIAGEHGSSSVREGPAEVDFLVVSRDRARDSGIPAPPAFSVRRSRHGKPGATGHPPAQLQSDAFAEKSAPGVVARRKVFAAARPKRSVALPSHGMACAPAGKRSLQSEQTSERGSPDGL